MSFDNVVKRLEQVSLLKAGSDPPVVGFCRVGFTLVGVQVGDFENITKRVEQIATPNKLTFGGTPQVTFSESPKIRFGVFTNHFDNLIKQLER